MAQLKDTVISGSLRVTDTILGNLLSISGTSTLLGNVGIGAAADNSMKLYIEGNFKSKGNIIPQATNTYTLGDGSTPLRWKNVYIGTANTYGDAYTPVYWNAGVPTAVTPTQHVAFTINNGKYGVTLTSDAFTANSEVLEIVVTTNAQNLKDKISWTSASGYINLTTDVAPDANVTGYIIVSRGGSVTPTATDITTAS